MAETLRFVLPAFLLVFSMQSLMTAAIDNVPPDAEVGAFVAEKPDVGLPLSIPVVSVCEDVENRADDACVLAADADYTCSDVAEGYYASCQNDWGDLDGYQTYKAVIIYYGTANQESDYQTRGANKNYVTHRHAPDDIHTSTTWILNYSGGAHKPGCDDFRDHAGYGAHDGWHGQMVEGALAEDLSNWNGGTCQVSSPKGIFGAGISLD